MSTEVTTRESEGNYNVHPDTIVGTHNGGNVYLRTVCWRSKLAMRQIDDSTQSDLTKDAGREWIQYFGEHLACNPTWKVQIRGTRIGVCE